MTFKNSNSKRFEEFHTLGNAWFNERPSIVSNLGLLNLNFTVSGSLNLFLPWSVVQYRITKIYTTHDECMYKSIKLILGHEPRNVVQSLKLVEAVSSHIWNEENICVIDPLLMNCHYLAWDMYTCSHLNFNFYLEFVNQTKWEHIIRT